MIAGYLKNKQKAGVRQNADETDESDQNGSLNPLKSVKIRFIRDLFLS
jgi:hypothetical protein